MAEKKFDPEDPMTLTGVSLPGDTTEAMAECFVEEFLLLGYSDTEIFYFFKNPNYAATNRVYRERGEVYVKELIGRTRNIFKGDGDHGKSL